MFRFLLAFFFIIRRVLSGCTVDNSSFLNGSSFTVPALSPTNEIIGGIDYGKLYAISNGLWMLQPFNSSKSATQISSSCPAGWVPPTKDDLTNLLQYAGTNVSKLTDPTTFNMNTSLYYASNTKVYPNITNGSDNNAWVFYGITFNATGAFVNSVSAYWDNAKTKLLCVLSAKSINNPLTSSSALNISGLSKKDLIKGIKYTLSVNNTNMVGWQWTLSGQSNTSKDINFIPMKYGQFLLNAKATLFDGTTVGYCQNVWVRNYTGSEANTTINSSSINQVKYNNTKVYRSTSLHFTSGSAPIAPIDEGGAYLIYANSSNNNSLAVKTIDNDGNQLNEISISKNGYPFDIVAIPCGFVALIMDYTARDTLSLFGWDTCANQKIFERIIMDNGNQPNVSNADQIIFYQDNASTPLFGMLAMYDPTSGRLSFGKGRIAAVFAHYNHFGFNADGSRNDHTGDTLLSFDLKGQDVKIAWSWGCSHSLMETMMYNGDRVMLASLGDAYPQNIRFADAEILLSNSDMDLTTGLYNRLDENDNSTLLPDTIPGCGCGKSCGRMGLVSIFNDGGFNTVSYARRSCSASYSGTTYTSTVDEMGVVLYDNNLKKVGDINLGSGATVNQIQSAKYGNFLFVASVNTNRTDGNFLPATIASTDQMSYQLISLNGTTIAGPFAMNGSILPSSDDMRILSDGRIAWTWVDTNYTLNYYYLSKPDQTPTNEAMVRNTSFYQNNADFYLINSNDTNIYKSTISGIMVQNNSGGGGTNGGGSGNGSFLPRIIFRGAVFSLVLIAILVF